MSRKLNIQELYAKLGPVIFARCRRLLRDDTAAEDAVQEVFIRVMKHAKELPPDSVLVKWIIQIAKNHCLNALRDRERQAKPVAEIPDQAGEHPMGEHERRELARRALEDMPESYRQPALLCYVEGMTHTEAARILGLSRRTIINRLLAFDEKARSKLRPPVSASGLAA